MEWISINDKLPECCIQHRNIYESDLVLVYTIWGDIEIDRLYEEYFDGKLVYRGWSENDEEVTHWMFLPKSPK